MAAMAGNRERDVILVEREGGSLKWFVLGAALGAGLALLFTPRSGREMRRELGKGVRRLRTFADETLEEFREEIGSHERVAREAVDSAELEEKEGEEGSAGSKRTSTSPARLELERRLAEARARRRQAGGDEEEEPVA